MMSVIPAGFTRLDNETDVVTLLSLPNALVQPYLFLLTRARLTRPAAHWGEVAAAIGRGQTQTHSALRQLKELGLVYEDTGSWLLTRREVAQKPAGKSPDVYTETRRKPAMTAPEIIVSDEENPTLKEGTEGKKEQKEVNTPPTPQGGEAQESTAPGAVAEIAVDLVWENQTPNSTTPDGEAANAADTDLPEPHQEKTTPPAGSETNATNNKNVPRRAAAKFDPLSLELPAAVSAHDWCRWVQHRQDIKKPLTEQAAVLTLRDLTTAAANGWDVTEMVDAAIAHRWTGCTFDKHREPRSSTHVVEFQRHPPARPRTTEEANQRFVANMAANAEAIKGIF